MSAKTASGDIALETPLGEVRSKSVSGNLRGGIAEEVKRCK